MTNEEFEPIRIRIMKEAYDLADRNDLEGYNATKVMCGDVQSLMQSQIIWLEQQMKVLVEELDEISKDRDDWAKKYQALSLASNKTKNEIDFDHAKETQKRYTHMPYGCYKLVTHGDGTITPEFKQEKK